MTIPMVRRHLGAAAGRPHRTARAKPPEMDAAPLAASSKKAPSPEEALWDSTKPRLQQSRRLPEAEYSPGCCMRVLGRSGHAHGRPKPCALDVVRADVIVLDPAMSPIPETLSCPRCKGALVPDAWGDLRPILGVEENFVMVARRCIPVITFQNIICPRPARPAELTDASGAPLRYKCKQCASAAQQWTGDVKVFFYTIVFEFLPRSCEPCKPACFLHHSANASYFIIKYSFSELSAYRLFAGEMSFRNALQLSNAFAPLPLHARAGQTASFIIHAYERIAVFSALSGAAVGACRGALRRAQARHRHKRGRQPRLRRADSRPYAVC